MAIRHVECSGRHRQIAVAGPTEGLLPVQQRRSLARDAIGERLPSLRPGAVWILSEARDASTFLEEQWLRDQLQLLGIQDVATVILGTKGGQVDYCELQFGQTPTRLNRALLDDLAPALTRAWEGRLPGTVERLITRRRTQEQLVGPQQDDLLDASNPAELSRSEYRICALVREGLLARAIAEELGVSEATVRSHLHSIYAKTGAAGHVDLLHRLSRPARSAEDVQPRARLAG